MLRSASRERHSWHSTPPGPPTRCSTSKTKKTFLAPLPITAADPSPKLLQILTHWGLRTLNDVTAISCEAFVRRFGGEGLAFWQRAAGGDLRPLRPVETPQTFTASMEFEHAVETLEPLLFILRRFLDRLSLELQAAQFVAAEIDFELKLENDLRHARSFRLPEPTADPEILFRALHTHLEAVRTDSSITAIGIKLTPARPLVRQQGLFEAGLRDPHGFAETLARAAALVGSDRIGTPQLADTHRPDAIKLIAPSAVIAPPATPSIHARLSTPLNRFRPPFPARLAFLDDGTPAHLWTDYVHGDICAYSKPYPTSGEWWQADRAWQREEQDIELAQGGLYRLVHTGGAWFLEGEYD